MSLATTPQYIFELLEKELYDHNETLLKNVATKYNVNPEIIFADFLKKKLNIISDEDVIIEITKKNNPKKPTNEDTRCMARIWNRGKGGQCSRNKSEDCDYCSQHKEKRKHGRIDEIVPRELFQKKSNVLYKHK
jgi:hypothetical protein